MMRAVLCFVVVGFLASCAALKSEQAVPVCPETGFIKYTDTIEIRGAVDPTLVSSSATMDDFTGGCKFDDQNNLDIELNTYIRASRGAANPELPFATYPFFVAVLNADDKVLNKDIYEAEVQFEDNGFGFKEEKLRLVLPRTDDTSAPSYKIVMGFQLTPEQLAHNRKRQEIK